MKNILLIGSNGLIGSKIKKKFEADGGDVNLLSVDISEEFDLNDRASIKKYFRSHVNINYIINCGGLNNHVVDGDIKCNTIETDLEHLDNFMQVNVKSVCWLIEDGQKYLPNLCGIINFSSLYGLKSPYHPIYETPKSLSYTLSKHALEGVTKYYAAFYGPKQLRINAVRVGGIESDEQPQGFKDWFVSQTPLGRMGDVEDLVGVIELLCSDKSAFITGQNITVDGGLTVW